MKKTIIAIMGLLFAVALSAQDAKEIIRKADDNARGVSNKSTIEMSVVRPKYTRTIGMKGWSLGKDYFMAYITSPAKEKGQVILKSKNEMWQYTPSINRMIKLPPSMMSQGFMGSDYSNDDLVKQSSIVNDYDQMLKGEEKIDGRTCYKIELIPHSAADIVWGKVIYWVDAEKYVLLKGEFYDEEDYLVRTELGKDVKQFDGRWLPSVIEIIPEDEPENKTIIKTLTMDFDIAVKASFFSQRNMKRVR